jgi:hypothetical protein
LATSSIHQFNEIAFMKKISALLCALTLSSLAHADIVGNWQFVSSTDTEDIQLFNGNFQFRTDGTFSNTSARDTSCNSASGVWSNDTGTAFQLQVTLMTCDGVSTTPDFLYTAAVTYVRDDTSLVIRGEGMEYRYQGSAVSSQPDCLFSWAESNYPSLFASQGNASQTAGEYYYRQYANDVYLGLSSRNSHIYYLAGGQLSDVGTASEWYARAGCQ